MMKVCPSPTAVLAAMVFTAVVAAAAASTAAENNFRFAGPTPDSVKDLAGLGQVRVRRSPDFFHPLLQDKRRQPAAFASPYMSSMRRLHTRRTMPFQLIPHQPLEYSRSRSFVGETMPRVRQSGLGSAADFGESEMDTASEKSPAEILSLLENLTSNVRNQKNKVRYGFF